MYDSDFTLAPDTLHPYSHLPFDSQFPAPEMDAPVPQQDVPEPRPAVARSTHIEDDAGAQRTDAQPDGSGHGSAGTSHDVSGDYPDDFSAVSSARGASNKLVSEISLDKSR